MPRWRGQAGGDTSTSERTADAGERGPGRRFVGRTRELDTLASRLRGVASGQGQFVAIAGDAGIGKTRTVEEFLARARLPETRVLWGRCPEDEGVPAYWPWAQVIRAYVEQSAPDALRDTLGSSASEISRLVPAVRERLPAVAPAPGPAESRFHLFEGVAAFFQRLAIRDTHVLVLEDLHWADEDTIVLLGFVAPEIRRSRLLIVGTYRDAEMRRSTRHLAQVARADERLALRGLDPADVEQLVADTTGTPVPAALVEQLHRVTGGNPYFAGELARWLRVEGRASTDLALELPEEVRELIRQRLAPLGPETRRLLAVAATIGQEFDLGLVETILGAAADLLLERITIAARAGFVRDSRRAAGRFEFVHALVRETLYHDLPAVKRAELHRAIGRALEAIPTADPGGARVAELAHHYFHAASLGEARAAAEYALAAGELAIASLGYDDAAGHYARALELLPLTRPDPAFEVRVRLALGDATCRAGDHARAQGEFVNAAELSARIGDASGAALAAIGFGEARPHAGVADPTQLRLLEEALARLDAGDSVLRVRVLAALAEALYGVPAAAARREAMSQEAVAMARRVGDPAALASALAARHFTRGDSLDARLAMAAESGRIGRELRDHRRSLDSLAWLIGDLLELGDVAAVDRELESFARAADQVRMPFYHWAVTTLRASRALLAGRLDDGIRLAAEARAVLADDDPISIAEQIHAVQKAIVDDERDRLLDSEAALVLLASRIPEVPGWRCSLAALYAGLGRDGEARSLLEQLAAGDFADLPRDFGFTGALAMLARAVVALRDVPRARLLYDLLLPYAERAIVVGFGIACHGAAARYLALLAATLGRPEAARHFEDALTVNARMGARPLLAHTQREYAEFLVARGEPGDDARALALRDEARRTATELGMARLGAALEGASATAEPAPSAGGTAGSFRRSDGAWTVTFAGESFRLSDTKGVHYLVTLLRHPCEEFHALLLGTAAPAAVSEPEARTAGQAGLRTDAPGDAGEHLDVKARDAYRRRLSELRAERAEAERSGDAGRIEHLDREVEMLTQELARAIGLGGRARRAGSATERARLNVTRALTTVLRKIASEHPVLGEHLAATIRTGTFVSYTPEPRSPMRWEL